MTDTTVATPLPATEIAALDALFELTAAAYYLADDTEQSGPVNESVYTVPGESFQRLSDALDKLDGLPDDQPGVIMGPAAKAGWALRRITAELTAAVAPSPIGSGAAWTVNDLAEGLAALGGERLSAEYLEQADHLLAHLSFCASASDPNPSASNLAKEGEEAGAKDKRIAELEAQLAAMEARKDGAYEERNRVVAALAKVFPSGTCRTDIPGWSDDWHGCVRIDLPTGQVSWHFHDTHAHLFAELPAYAGEWDGHDTPEKYRRLAALSAPTEGPADEERFDYLSDAQARELFGTEDDDKLPDGRVRVCAGEWVRIPGGYYFDAGAGLLHPETAEAVPVASDSAPATDALARAEKAERERDAYHDALTPDGDTKALMIGEFFEEIEVRNPDYDGESLDEDEDDEPEFITHRVPVSWTTTKAMMERLRSYAHRLAASREAQPATDGGEAC